MPRYPIERSTNFIVEEESWSVIEYDHTSVPGTIYLSLTEGKINSIYDDVPNNLADTDKQARYALSLPTEIQTFAINTEIQPIFTITKNGVPLDTNLYPFTITPATKDVVHVVDGKLMGYAVGTTELIIQLKDFPQIQQKMMIEVVDTEDQQLAAYLEGSSSIRLDRKATYYLRGCDAAVFVLQDTALASISEMTENTCVIKANAKNLLGDIVLYAKKDDTIICEKTISIIPLW